MANWLGTYLDVGLIMKQATANPSSINLKEITIATIGDLVFSVSYASFLASSYQGLLNIVLLIISIAVIQKAKCVNIAPPITNITRIGLWNKMNNAKSTPVKEVGSTSGVT